MPASHWPHWPLQVCAPLPPPEPSSPSGPAAAAIPLLSGAEVGGVCARPAAGTLLPSTYPSAWPTPLAYFPLTEGVLASWPSQRYTALAAENVSWTLDTRFGNVLTCDKVGWGGGLEWLAG